MAAHAAAENVVNTIIDERYRDPGMTQHRGRRRMPTVDEIRHDIQTPVCGSFPAPHTDGLQGVGVLIPPTPARGHMMPSTAGNLRVADAYDDSADVDASDTWPDIVSGVRPARSAVTHVNAGATGLSAPIRGRRRRAR